MYQSLQIAATSGFSRRKCHPNPRAPVRIGLRVAFHEVQELPSDAGPGVMVTPPLPTFSTRPGKVSSRDPNSKVVGDRLNQGIKLGHVLNHLDDWISENFFWIYHPYHPYCWWFRNLEDQQLRLVGWNPMIYKVLYMPAVVVCNLKIGLSPTGNDRVRIIYF